MSRIVDQEPLAIPHDAPNVAMAAPAAPRGPSILAWGIISVVLLIGSGVVRSAQSSYFDEVADLNVESPFPLRQIPKTLDGWHLVEGSETVLDPLTTRITGSTDHILGNYRNDETGVVLTVLLLYGPAEPVLPHTPEVCYPATGYKAVAASVDRDIPVGKSKVARFRSNMFAKSGGRNLLQRTVYHSFRHDGTWVPWVNTKNSPRKNPGIFKVQIDRQVAVGESRFQDEPVENFVEKLIPVLEKMIADAQPPSSVGSVTQK